MKNNSVPWKLVDDELVIIDTYRYKLLKLNDTARVIWELLDGKHTATQIVDILLEQFDTKRDILEKDVYKFINLLFKREVIK